MHRMVDVFDAASGELLTQVGRPAARLQVAHWAAALADSRPADAKRSAATCPAFLPPPCPLASPQLHSDHMTAIPSRNVAHPALPVLAAATNSGRIHVYR